MVKLTKEEVSFYLDNYTIVGKFMNLVRETEKREFEKMIDETDISNIIRMNKSAVVCEDKIKDKLNEIIPKQ